jgi:hypothetical protein
VSEEVKKNVTFDALNTFTGWYKCQIFVDGTPIGIVEVGGITDITPTQVCGSASYRDFNVSTWLPGNPTSPGHSMDHLGAVVAKCKELGVFDEVSQHLLQKVAAFLVEQMYNIVMGGRINLDRTAWEARFGVYSIGVADQLRKMGKGTITFSHVYGNPSHSRFEEGGNFALHQTITYTPPKLKVWDMPETYGVFIDKKSLDDTQKFVDVSIASRYISKEEADKKLHPAYLWARTQIAKVRKPRKKKETTFVEPLIDSSLKA